MGVSTVIRLLTCFASLCEESLYTALRVICVTGSVADGSHSLTTSNKVKVKVTLLQALSLCTGHTAHRCSRGIALLFHGHGTRRGLGVSFTPLPLFTPAKDPVSIV